MKLFFVLAAVTVAQAAKLDRVYLPPNARASAGSNFLQTPFQASSNQAPNAYSSAATYNSNTYAQNAYSGYEARNERAQAARERNAAILRQDNSNDGETYSYAYETENGIYAEESGVATNGVQAQGGYSYTGDDGKVYSVRYTADENGFVPQGDHLPTPPPIPEEILRALEKNAREEAAGIYDDGSYTEPKYVAAGNTQQQYYNINAQPINYNEDSVVTDSASLRNANGFNRNSVIANSASLRNGYGFNRNSVIANSASLRNGNGFNRNSIIANSASLRNGNGFNRNSIIANSASLRNSNGFNRNSVEKTYLPPFSRGNGNLNVRTGYNY